VRVIQRMSPDVALLDIRMPVMDGIQAMRWLADSGSHTRLLAFTTFDVDEYVFEALRAGASGFLLNDASVEELASAMRLVVSGEAAPAPTVTRRVVDALTKSAPTKRDPSMLASFTPRGLDILRLLARGLSNAEIAQEVCADTRDREDPRFQRCLEAGTPRPGPPSHRRIQNRTGLLAADRVFVGRPQSRRYCQIAMLPLSGWCRFASVPYRIASGNRIIRVRPRGSSAGGAVAWSPESLRSCLGVGIELADPSRKSRAFSTLSACRGASPVTWARVGSTGSEVDRLHIDQSPPQAVRRRLQKPVRPLSVLHVGTINKPITRATGYGPIETVIFNLDRGLHELGHRSIVACSSDSAVTGEHCATIGRSLGDYCRSGTPEAQAQIDLHLAGALARARRGDIDIIHMHEWFEHVYTGRFASPVPIVMTLHVPGERSGLSEFRTRHPRTFAASRSLLNAVAISDYQRQQYSQLLPVARTIPHGVSVHEYLFKAEANAGTYLFSIGRMTEDKGQDLAIEVARKSGAKLILAGGIQDKEADRAFFARLMPLMDMVVDLSDEPVTPRYYEDVMQPILTSGNQVIYIGELGTDAAKHWYRHAEATLFPIRWGEPFGMVLIESMASGTPVVAFRNGSVPEIVCDGETGFVVDSVDEMVAAVGRVSQLNRANSWRHVQANFSVERMAASYASLYRDLAAAPPTSVQPVAQRETAATPVLARAG
jgi:glycosyltransferase involved in cell wall biosynthesis/CheY-like chemotaxis protein